VYRSDGRTTPEPAARALIAGIRPGGAVGSSAQLIVAGADHRAACAAARTLARRPGAIAGAYAVALDGAGTVIAIGGRR
jgi:hypothetical protein